jgi:hypothetical protein
VRRVSTASFSSYRLYRRDGLRASRRRDDYTVERNTHHLRLHYASTDFSGTDVCLRGGSGGRRWDYLDGWDHLDIGNCQ